MRLPNFGNALIDDSKLLDYCLNKKHDIGKHKAFVFESALGITANDYLKLKQAILDALAFENCYESFANLHGKLYVVDFEMINFEKKVMVRTSWIIKNQENFPRLTTCYVKT